MLPLSRELARCLELANHEAKRLGSARLEPAHLLLGFCAADPSLAPSLRSLPLHVSLRLLRLHLEKLTARTPGEVVRDVLPRSAPTRRHLMDAAGDARHRGHAEITREHLLANLLHDDGGIAGHLLQCVGIDPSIVRQGLIQALDHGCPSPAPVTAIPVETRAGVLAYEPHPPPSLRRKLSEPTREIFAGCIAFFGIVSLMGLAVLLFISM